MIIGFSPAILMPCWAMGSGTLSPDLLSLHPATGQPVPVASNARTVRNVTGRDRVRAAPYALPDARRSPMGRAPDNHATPLPESGTPHGDVPIRTGVADHLSDLCRTSTDGAQATGGLPSDD
jgi:hypothetical protein